MGARRFAWSRRSGRAAGTSEKKSLEEKLRRLKDPEPDYRRQSLAIHGWICAKCAREFDESNLHLLTVHHKDGNPRNNPTDGSNWENLCVYCHDDVHSRETLGSYLEGEGDRE